MTLNEKDDPLAPEERRMKLAVAAVTLAWADVENLSATALREILNHPTDNRIAAAIYFASRNIETRLTIVDRAFRQFICGTKHEKEIVAVWESMQRTLSKLRATRGKVAHGEIITHRSNGKSYVRFTAPLADYRQQDEARESGQLPGMSVNDLEQSAKAVREAADRLIAIIPLVRTIYSGNEQMLLNLLPRLLSNSSN